VGRLWVSCKLSLQFYLYGFLPMPDAIRACNCNPWVEQFAITNVVGFGWTNGVA
jgi:hypothetical protein